MLGNGTARRLENHSIFQRKSIRKVTLSPRIETVDFNIELYIQCTVRLALIGHTTFLCSLSFAD